MRLRVWAMIGVTGTALAVMAGMVVDAAARSPNSHHLRQVSYHAR